MEVTSRDSIIRETSVAAYTVPTDFPESDGTLAWDKTTVVLVHASAADKIGMGYTYADIATAQLIKDTLIPLVHRNGRHGCSSPLVRNATCDSEPRTARNLLDGHSGG